MNNTDGIDGANNKIVELKSQISQSKVKNDVRIKFWQEQIGFEEERIKLLKKINVLYKDKIILRTQVDNLTKRIEEMIVIVSQLHHQLSSEINQLKNYNNLIPSEREKQLQMQVNDLKYQLEVEQRHRKEVEGALQCSNNDLQNLFTDAQEAKGIILEQLIEIKEKKE